MSHHEISSLDDIVHQRTRLALLSVLVEADGAETTYLKKSLNLTDGNLGRHLGVLQEAGMIVVTKTSSSARARSWVAVTDHGRESYYHEIRVLTQLVGAAQSSARRGRGSSASRVHGGIRPETSDAPDDGDE